MSSRTPRIFLDDILSAVDKIERYSRGMTREEFAQQDIVIDAVLRNLEVIGEAASNIPEDLRERYAHIPWRRIIGLRNIVIHAYFDVDLAIIWQIIQVNLPSTKKDLIEMRSDLEKTS